VNCVCVVRGVSLCVFDVLVLVAESSAIAAVLVAGNAWIPSACACFECVKKANGAVLKSSTSFPPLFLGELEDLGSRFCVDVGGCSRERSFEMRASLRVFSARRAA